MSHRSWYDLDIDTRSHIVKCGLRKRGLRPPHEVERDRQMESARAEAAAFNVAHPIGTPVRYWPFLREGDGITGKTRSEAWVPPSGTAMVLCTGRAGGIALTHVECCRDRR